MIRKKSSWIERHAIGAAPPAMIGEASRSPQGEVTFLMALNGVDTPFIIGPDVLATLSGEQEGQANELAMFAKARARIIGVAGRILRAGVTASPVVMHSAYF